MSYARTKVWVCFKAGLDGGEWRGGFYAADKADPSKPPIQAA